MAIQIIKANDYEELSALACKKIADIITQNPSAVLGLATGSTPVGLYKKLIESYQKENLSFKEVRTVNLDEYIGLPKNHPNSYHTFMKNIFFSQIDILESNTHIPDGTATDLEEEGLSYERLIQALGGIDLQILGIGHNGHIGFNEPGTSFHEQTHLVELTDSTRKANARFFPSLNDVPKQAITMGIGTILKSKEILLLASGSSKADAVKQLLSGEVSIDFPASALKNHPSVALVADKEALSLM
ncbi:glucosamine-6-phosphate deaminase [Peribacillus acanthi]|uniref:glucosamine-6-phosphate deaminase n=1 Tax=Peribacillus acanthi TaxID=2171554 RepID=UPI000D3E4383|nr:glucosamine-6-phosphate deaminase [Peribacillus acanthi]